MVLVWCLVLMGVAYTYQVKLVAGHKSCHPIYLQASCVFCCLPEGDFLKYVLHSFCGSARTSLSSFSFLSSFCGRNIISPSEAEQWLVEARTVPPQVLNTSSTSTSTESQKSADLTSTNQVKISLEASHPETERNSNNEKEVTAVNKLQQYLMCH